MRAAVVGEQTLSRPLRKSETVVVETPACWATSLMVALRNRRTASPLAGEVKYFTYTDTVSPRWRFVKGSGDVNHPAATSPHSPAARRHRRGGIGLDATAGAVRRRRGD